MTRSGIRLLFVFLLLLALHFTVRPVLHWRASIDFMLIAIMLISVRVRPGVAAIVGMVAGFIVDAQTPASLGSGAIGLACVGFAASLLKGSFFADKPAMNASLFFIAKWVYEVLYIIVEGRVGGGATFEHVFLVAPLAAVLTAIAGSITMSLLQPVLREART